MRNKMVYKYVGKVLIAYAILLLVPLILSFVYHGNRLAFLIPLLVSLVVGLLLNLLKKDESSLFAREGFLIVSISWLVISIISALPFVISGELKFVDAFFEAVSGLTTTGATVFKDVEHLNKSLLFWRSFTHFIGGMGVLAFVMAIIPLSKNDKSMHVLKAEMPGPSVAKLVPGIKKTLFYLYGIYLGLTLIEVILLLIGGMNFFSAVLTSMSTAGTGGFAVLNSSIASYSPFCKYVIGTFMFLFGVNFNIYFLILMKDFKSAFKSEELKVYFLIFISAVLIVFLNTYQMFNSLAEAFTSSFFHISSFMSSTGFSISDVNIYPTACKVLVLFLMLISASAGSTCGGFKVARLIICFKTIKRDLLKLVHPNSIYTITFEGKKVSEDTIKSTTTYLFLYFGLLILLLFIVGFDRFSLEETINAVFTTFANVGLCFKLSNFAIFSSLSKICLSIGMLFGRLEIFPLIVLFTDLRK